VLAERGRRRIKERRAAAGLTRSVAELRKAADATKSNVERAAYLTIAADLHERMRLYADALGCLDEALAKAPGYLPALHARARILEATGDAEADADAVDTLYELAMRLSAAEHRSSTLCRAGTLALARAERGQKNPRAWEMFVEALKADPGNDRAFRGLRRTHARHGAEGAPPVADALDARLADMRERKLLRGSGLRDLARLGGDLEGPRLASKLLEAGLEAAPDDPGLRVDLAQAYARLERWNDCVEQLEAALASEPTPERSAALHYFAGDAYASAGRPADAVSHYLEAGRGGFAPRHALVSADRLAARAGDLARRVEALQLLVEIGSGPERAAGLRSLADLYQGPLGQPDAAIERMRELLLLRPTDIDVVLELVRLLEAMERRDEATAALLAGVAHHRAWLRSSGLSGETPEQRAAPVAGLLRLFDAMDEMDGVYLSASAVEVVDKSRVPPGQLPDELVGEPWPLPTAQDGRPFDGLVGDLPGGPGLDLLREGVFYLGSLPGAEPPTIDVTSRRSLPPNSAVVMVARALGNAMGVNEPMVFVDPRREEGVIAYVAPTPCLVVGRRINGSPFGAAARDQLGRALLRLSTGGDALHRGPTPDQVLAILIALSRATGVVCEPPPGRPFDSAYCAAVAESLPGSASLADLREVADAFAGELGAFDPALLLDALHMAEDRAGVVCAADPRPTLQALAASDELFGARGTALVGYLLSDDHLALRRSLGYLADVSMPQAGRRELHR